MYRTVDGRETRRVYLDSTATTLMMRAAHDATEAFYHHDSNTHSLLVDRLLNCRGLRCPLPAMKTTKTLSKMEVGQVLQVISTDPGSSADMLVFSERTGHELLAEIEDAGDFHIFFRRVSHAAPSSRDER